MSKTSRCATHEPQGFAANDRSRIFDLRVTNTRGIQLTWDQISTAIAASRLQSMSR